MSIIQRMKSYLHKRTMNKDACGDEIAHHIRDLGMERDQAVAVAYAEDKCALDKNVTVATGMQGYDQLGVRHKPEDVSDIVKKATQQKR